MGVASPEQLEHFKTNDSEWQRLHTYGLNMIYFTIGNVEINSKGDERLTTLNLQTAQVY
jgi:hypothetical protein